MGRHGYTDVGGFIFVNFHLSNAEMLLALQLSLVGPFYGAVQTLSERNKCV